MHRYSISDRAAAALYNGALKDQGIIIDGRDQAVVDKSKIRRARQKYRAKEKAKKKANIDKLGGIKCIGTDGKRDKKTRKRVVTIVNDKEVVKTVTGPEEHISYTIEPDGEYLCHSTLEKGHQTGLDHANDFLDVLADNSSKDSLEAVIIDGTFVNTGWKSGFVAILERVLCKLLLMLVCQLHGNELPLR